MTILTVSSTPALKYRPGKLDCHAFIVVVSKGFISTAAINYAKVIEFSLCTYDINEISYILNPIGPQKILTHIVISKILGCPNAPPCDISPCKFAKCEPHPDAYCVPNFCSCNATFYDKNWKEVDCKGKNIIYISFMFISYYSVLVYDINLVHF